MEINSEKLLLELNQYVNNHLEFTNSLKERTNEELNWKLTPKSWSVLECLEHLNRYGAFYIPEIKKKMESSSIPKSDTFQHGFLGNKFALDMLPKEKMKKMKTFKSKNPVHSKLGREEVMGTFIKQQKDFLELLTIATEKNLTKIKVSTTIPLLKFRLGDTFRFVIYHNERHIMQVKKVLFSQKII